MRIVLGDTVLMDKGQPLPFDEKAASAYLKGRADVHGTVNIQARGRRAGVGWAWGLTCSLCLANIVAGLHLLSALPKFAANGLPATACHQTPTIPCPHPAAPYRQVTIGDGPGRGMAWGCDLSYDYVKINAEYTTSVEPRNFAVILWYFGWELDSADPAFLAHGRPRQRGSSAHR